MDAKITVTTRCNAHCMTCPVWTLPEEDMPIERFEELWEKLNNSSLISRILLNGTGDLFNYPDKKKLLDIIKKRDKFTILTTNSGKMDEVPDVDLLIISFNGGTKETYERITWLDFDKTISNVKRLYEDIKKLRAAEIHCLIYEGNKGTEKNLIQIFDDFPGRIRVSYKYDNQMEEDKTIELFRQKDKDRIVCDYLSMLVIMPSGKVVSCNHDFYQATNFGNVFDVDDLSSLVVNKNRLFKLIEHSEGQFSGLCSKCNYNVPIKPGEIVYLK